MVKTAQKNLRPSPDTVLHSREGGGVSDMSFCVKLWKFKDKNINNIF